jgi:hypothetical protein
MNSLLLFAIPALFYTADSEALRGNLPASGNFRRAANHLSKRPCWHRYCCLACGELSLAGVVVHRIRAAVYE